MKNADKKAVVLLSGGLDSATVLAIARNQGFSCYAMSFDYGQRHTAELQAAKNIAQTMGAVEQRVMPIGLGALGGSALTDNNVNVPENTTEDAGIPVTYVPARNTVFLALALGWAEVLQARTLFIGVNAVDYSGYPDCRPAFIESFEKTANLGTQAGVEGKGFTISTPLIAMSKAQIIQKGTSLGVDYALTVSCYQANDQGKACGRCDSCRLRKKGFTDAGIPDPTRYVSDVA